MIEIMIEIDRNDRNWAFPEKHQTPLLRTLDIQGVAQIKRFVDIQGVVTKELVDIQRALMKKRASRG